MTRKILWLGAAFLALLAFKTDLMARITGTQPTSADIWCAGPSGAEVCVDASGNLVPTTDNDTTLGSSSLRWATVNALDVAVADDLTVTDDATVSDDLTVTGDLFKTMVSTVTGINGATISIAGACGGILRLSTNQNSTTDTTNTFTAPASDNAGCIVFLVNVGNGTITLDDNARFDVPANITLGTNDTATIGSTGVAWYLLGSVADN